MRTFIVRVGGLGLVLATLAAIPAPSSQAAGPSASSNPALPSPPTDSRLCVVLGLPDPEGAKAVIELSRPPERTVYFQSSRPAEVAAIRQAAAAAGILGTRVFADVGPLGKIHLADNLADAILVVGSAEKETADQELLRVLHPEAKAVIGSRQLVKPLPKDTDSWSHVYHGPDNNPLSHDQQARAPYLTQFLAEPLFCPMPEVSVAAGGRVFRAFGHIAHKANQNALLNTLVCSSGYNGAILWRRPLHEGFMIHRNTMVASPDALYLGDDQSCKRLDARTGRLLDEIVVPADISDGPVWKWMAIDRNVLYALVGAREIRPKSQPSDVPGLGHWPWGMWEGHEYADPKSNFGFGRTFLAVDPKTKRILWSHRESEYIDARGLCLRGGRIYYYSPGKFLACLDAASGHPVWKNADADLLQAIGTDGRAQHYLTGYSTTTFLKATDRYLFCAGPQRSRLVAASTRDGKLLWQREPGNVQLVLRDEAIYAAGQQNTTGYKLAYETGQEIGPLPARRACTRATGTVDSVFFRASGGTVRMDLATETARHIAPMRPPCQDGVIVSDGFLYWGPWMCGCQLSLYGHICLGPAGKFDFTSKPDDARLVAAGGAATVQPFSIDAADWPTYLADNARSGTTAARAPRNVSQRWTTSLPAGLRPTAPIIAGGSVFIGDSSGTLRALNADDGALRWQARTGGAIFYPPALWQGRLYVGSADGRVYAFEAASGRQLWCFRAAPAERWIPVYGKLMSTWPVAGGVVVADGVVYAAAGIAHYDGTYVYALDATTGRMKWCNNSSGNLSEKVSAGVSLQGHLYIAEGELRFLGGGKYETARYDLATGRCLNEPDDTITSRFQTAFAPYFPEYARYMSLEARLPGGREWIYDASYEGSQHRSLALWGPLPPGVIRPVKNVSRWPVARRGEPKRPLLWSDQSNSRYHCLVRCSDALLAAGHTGTGDSESPFVAALNLDNGAELWRLPLTASCIQGGMAIDSQGRIAVALENGQVVVLAAR